ncbi:uncharacterized protein LOC128895795 [Hylaeus anthracinus]|uniref:uncharacterized protein LOC128895795 n=1 Tax=Hylaeus anthracinus TaxID=313031 RepID=UPI0023BA0EE4|nr:uncharacterized protein LOC128895795 [Hylaeus anthracinus]
MDVLDEKDEQTLQTEARLKAPLVWDSPENCAIKDLHQTRYDEALRLIKHHYFREEPMCKASSLLRDQSSVNGYMELIRTRMKDTTSLIAVSVNSGRVIGVAVTRINSDQEKTNTYSRHQILEGETLQKIVHLKNTLIQQTNAYERFGHDEYFRIYILCVHPSYHGKGIEIALLNACVQVARTLNMPAIGGIFTCGASQSRAESVGFQLLSEIRYSQWIINNRVVFDDPGRGNYSAAFMGMSITLEEDPKDDETSVDELEKRDLE